jgi:hypothetical protein
MVLGWPWILPMRFHAQGHAAKMRTKSLPNKGNNPARFITLIDSPAFIVDFLKSGPPA